ncbi:MAG: metallophosphoesterase [Oscillospiraceae bacterium]|nr:metallophosphoesterase [Oscillospiraceae bacterium]
MQILVFSDSHNRIAPMEAMVRELMPDLILHLGDHESDAHALAHRFPDIPIRMVRGNCDWGGEAPLLENFELADKRVVMCHGHRYDVKTHDADLIAMGREAGADLLLFGHTHIPYYEVIDGIHVLNPGASSEGCGVIWIAGGEIVCELVAL